MVLRFLILSLLMILACSNHERDNVYDIEADDPSYGFCGSIGRYRLEDQRCGQWWIETKCGNGWYAEDDPMVKCENNVVILKCGDIWFNASGNLRCANSVVETKCGDGWFDASNTNLMCTDNIIEGRCGERWFNVNADLRCESGIIETQCGNGWFDASNPNSWCENKIVKVRCGDILFDANADLRCEANVIETKCGSNWYNASNDDLRCERNMVERKCGAKWFDANANLRCESGIVEGLCGNTWFDVEPNFCYNGKLEERCGNRLEAFDVELYECNAENKIYLKDKRYDAVLIGTETWMTENLNLNVDGSKCYENLDLNCDEYGRLYDLETAMKACPAGWHLPSDDEWVALIKSEGIEAYGFAAKFGGLGLPNDIFDGLDNYGGWWSASANYWHYDGYDIIFGNSDKRVLLSVRCVKDKD